MPCNCKKQKSEFVGKYTGKYKRTIIDASSDPNQSTECGTLTLEITQPDSCNKCAHLMILSYTPYNATGDFEEAPIALLGPLNAEGSIYAIDIQVNETTSSSVFHQFRLIDDCKLEHTLSNKGIISNLSPIWITECNKLKKVKEESKCSCKQ